MALDLALAYANDGKTLVLHRVDCPAVRKQAANGEPVLSLFDCQKLPSEDMKKHSCLDTD